MKDLSENTLAPSTIKGLQVNRVNTEICVLPVVVTNYHKKLSQETRLPYLKTLQVSLNSNNSTKVLETLQMTCKHSMMITRRHV